VTNQNLATILATVYHHLHHNEQRTNTASGQRGYIMFYDCVSDEIRLNDATHDITREWYIRQLSAKEATSNQTLAVYWSASCKSLSPV